MICNPTWKGVDKSNAMYDRGRCLLPMPENTLTDCTSMYAICAAPVGVSVKIRIVGLWISVSHDLAAVPDACAHAGNTCL